MDNREIHENFYTGVLELQELCEQFIEENNLFFENCPHLYPVVYIVKCEEYYKVGKSRAGIKKRIASLQIGNPKPLEVVLLIRSSDIDSLEAKLHNRFANKWLRGEWFKLEQSDIDYLLKRYDGSVWENPSKQLELKGLGIKNEIKK